MSRRGFPKRSRSGARGGSAILRSFDCVRDEIRAGGGDLELTELARRLLAVRGWPSPGLARRLVAAALRCPPDALPDRLGEADLAAARHGFAANAPLSRCGFVVVDLETTGLSPQRSQILEIGAVRIESLRMTDRFETLVDPGQPVPASITRLTGIDAALLAGAPGTVCALEDFQAWLAEAPDAIFVAHNAAFDAGFVRRGLAQHGLPALATPVLCTRRLSRRLVPRLGRYGLDALSAHFGISNGARHRALGDASAAARLLLELLPIALQQGVRTLGELLDLESRPPKGSRRRSAAPARGTL